MSGYNVLKFCITHDIPQHPLDEETVVIWLGDGKAYEGLKNNVVVVRDIYPDLDFYRPFLLGTAGTFAIRRLLEKLDNASRNINVCLQSYRKIVTRSPIGVESSTYPGMRVLNAHEQYDTSLCFPIGSDYLISMPINVGRYLTQYALVHKLEDFLRYTALALELGALANHEDAESFMMRDTLIPGGIELGVTPYQVFMDIVSALERVALEFCRRYRPADLDLNNRRAVAFCSERLGSHLLLKHIMQLSHVNVIRKSVGYMTVFTSEHDYLPNTR